MWFLILFIFWRSGRISLDFELFGGFWPFGCILAFGEEATKTVLRLNVVLDSVHFLAFWSDFGGFLPFLVDFCFFGGF